MSKQRSAYVLFFLPLTVILSCWQVAATLQWVNPLFFPPPSSIFARLWELLFAKPDFWQHVFGSGRRFLLGMALAIPLGTIVAFAVELNRVVGLSLKPLIALTYPIPRLAVLPLLMLIFGLGDAPKVFIIFLGAFYLMLLSVSQGLQRIVASGYLDLAKIYKIPRRSVMVGIYFKGVLPELINGIKIGGGYGLVMVVAGEFTVSQDGIGFFMWNAWDQFRILDVYAGLVILSLAGISLFYSCDLLEKRLKRY